MWSATLGAERTRTFEDSRTKVVSLRPLGSAGMRGSRSVPKGALTVGQTEAMTAGPSKRVRPPPPRPCGSGRPDRRPPVLARGEVVGWAAILLADITSLQRGRFVLTERSLGFL